MTPEEQARFSRLEETVKALQTKTETAEKQLADERAARAKDAAAHRRDAIKSRFDRLVEAKQLLPRSYELAKRFMRLDDDAEVTKVTEEEVKAFIDERKDADAAQLKINRGAGGGKGGSEGGADDASKYAGKTNDFVFNAKVEEDVVRVGGKLSNFADRQAAAERIMRADKKLARAYLDDPRGAYEPAA